MMPKMLQTKMKVNIEVRNGTNFRPSGPITSNTMPLRMNSTSDSTRFCSPFGTSRPPRAPIRNSTITITAAMIISSDARLKQLSPLPIRQGVSKISGPISLSLNPPSFGGTKASTGARTAVIVDSI